MIRFAEPALLLAPLAIYLFWLYARRRGLPGPSRQSLLIIALGVTALCVGLVWTGLSDRHPDSSRYVPAQLEGGRIVPGHGT